MFNNISSETLITIAGGIVIGAVAFGAIQSQVADLSNDADQHVIRGFTPDRLDQVIDDVNSLEEKFEKTRTKLSTFMTESARKEQADDDVNAVVKELRKEVQSLHDKVLRLKVVHEQRE